MTKTRRFTSNTGSGVSIYATGWANPIRVEADEPLETDDRTVIQALEASPEVVEVKRAVQK